MDNPQHINLNGLKKTVVLACNEVLKSWDGVGLPKKQKNICVIENEVDGSVWAKLMEFKSLIENREDCHSVVDDLGISLLARIGFSFWPKKFEAYLKYYASEFTKNRTKITHSKFLEKIFNRISIHPRTVRYQCTETSHSIDKVRKKIWDIVYEEETRQRSQFPKTNFQHMDLDKDHWTVFWLKAKGTGLQSAKFDFSIIKAPALKRAFKIYLKDKRWKHMTNFRAQNIIGMTARALNFLSGIGVDMPDDVKGIQVSKLLHFLFKDTFSFKNEKLTPSSVRGHFKILRGMWNYLLFPDEDLTSFLRVDSNPFVHVSFKQEFKTYQSAEYIPEEVIEQIVMYKKDLPENVWRLFQVMMETGLRHQDACLLEKDCLSYDDEIDCHILKATVHKTKKARIKRGLQEYILIGLTEPDSKGTKSLKGLESDEKNLRYFTNAVQALKDQVSETEEFRSQSGSNYIFLTRPENLSRSQRICVLSASGFVEPVRALIRKYKITDHDGNLWNFKSHQCRKTVAVTLVKNGATEVEMMHFLGHLNRHTTLAYYAQVRKMELAALNHEFYEKKFNTRLPEKHLSRFDAEERKILYVEFALGHREVELGHCTKHASDGPCGKRTGKTNCANCPHICTGPQHLQKWVSLVESQNAEVCEYEKAYKKASIPKKEYVNYREYQRAIKLLAQYNDGLNKITAYERN